MTVENGALTRYQKITVLSLSLPLTLRIFGIALVLPIFVFYGREFTDSPVLIALSFGAYGLPQALLQIPMGTLSDRIGRKKVIILGLFIFAMGSLIAAYPQNIWGLLAGRMIQGAGAISSSVMAFIGDIVPEGKRGKAMALVGMPFGLSFSFGLIGGPLIGMAFGYSAVFLFTAIVTFITLPVLAVALKEPEKEREERGIRLSEIARAVRNPNLLKVDVGGFFQNFFLISNFLVIPWFITMYLGIEGGLSDDYTFPIMMLPVIVIGLIAMWGASGIADRGRQRSMAVLGFAGMLMAAVMFYITYVFHPVPDRWSQILIVFGAMAFFSGFSVQEPVLKSLVMRLSPTRIRGAAAGSFNMTQFLGAFLGGVVSGIVIVIGLEHLLIVLMVLSMIGMAIMASLRLGPKGNIEDDGKKED